jgi:hypothetical protein
MALPVTRVRPICYSTCPPLLRVLSDMWNNWTAIGVLWLDCKLARKIITCYKQHVKITYCTHKCNNKMKNMRISLHRVVFPDVENVLKIALPRSQSRSWEKLLYLQPTTSRKWQWGASVWWLVVKSSSFSLERANNLSKATFKTSRIADAASRKRSYNLTSNPILDEASSRGLGIYLGQI